MSSLESGREFVTDRFTGQTFYREPLNASRTLYSGWVPLPPSDYHPQRPEAHNVLTHLPGAVGPLPPVDTVPAIASRIYGESGDAPPPTQAYPAPEIPSITYTQPLAQLPFAAHENPAPVAQVARDSTQTAGREPRHSQRSTRAYDPIRGQKADRPRERGRGRTRGAPNYRAKEVETLLDLVEDELPIASKGWRVVGARFRDWAIVTQAPARTDRSLELKFKQLVKTRKPTGNAPYPPCVRRAHEIDHKLQSKVACRDLEDDEIAEINVDEGDASDEEMSDSADPHGDTDRDSPIPHPRPTPRVRAARIETPLSSQDSARQTSSRGAEILERISKTFDPDVQSHREADRASSMFQTQQLIFVQSQIRDLNSTILSLRNQLDDSERRHNDADRRADRLQNQIDITSAVTRAHLHHSASRVPRHTTPISVPSTSESTPVRNRRWEATFRDGGRSTWFGNPNQLGSDDDIVEVVRVPWTPPPQYSPAQSPPASDSGYETQEV